MSDVLTKICLDKWKHINSRKEQVSEHTLLIQAKHMEAPRGFHRALKNKVSHGLPALIAEIKKASPSRGVIRNDFNVASLARAYVKGGATCLSVLTDTPYFQGRHEDVTRAHEEVKLPILRKDFMLDPYQVLEARGLGADCILIIMAAVSDEQAQELEAAAIEYGMDVLIEVHNREELRRAIKLKSKLIGINNRNLKTLEVDLRTTELLAQKIGKEYTVVCESGIYTHEDILRMEKVGVHCFLVGESLMKQSDVSAATRQLLGNS